MNAKIVKSAVVVAGTVGAVAARAAGTGVDVTAVTASIADQAAPVALIGAAVLVLHVGVKAFKWVRAALS